MVRHQCCHISLLPLLLLGSGSLSCLLRATCCLNSCLRGLQLRLQLGHRALQCAMGWKGLGRCLSSRARADNRISQSG